MLSSRIKRVAGSPTLAISTRAKEMRADGIDVVDFSVGEPDFPTPQNIKDAAKKAIDENHTRYTPTTGIPDLKKAINDNLNHHYGLTYEPNEIMVSSGAKNCLYNAAVALFNPGDEVLLPAPYWVSYPEQLNLVDAVPVILNTTEEHGFKITPDQLEASITEKTRALFLNNPSNPTGATYTRSELEQIGRIIVARDILVISDEIYDRIVYNDFEFTSFPSLGEEVKKRTILINGFSKTFAMTGFRLGYACGPKEIISAMARVQSHDTSNPCSISQKAGVEALNGPKTALDTMINKFSDRRDLILSKLSAIEGVTCHPPEGAFYVFPNFQKCIQNLSDRGLEIHSSDDLAKYLLEKAHVAVVPGEGFGADGYVRLSYAASAATIKDGMERITQLLSQPTPTPH